LNHPKLAYDYQSSLSEGDGHLHQRSLPAEQELLGNSTREDPVGYLEAHVHATASVDQPTGPSEPCEGEHDDGHD
jgi:hypothetical protein